ncbi:MAG: LCP family protein [Synergistaceae bacterium]|nr:LCP family protein [Synergistaceae bacterium]
MKRSKTIILIVVLAIIGIAAGAGLKVYTILHTKSQDLFGTIESSIDSGSAQYAALKEQGRFNILIMGEDDVEGSRRSDTVLFATIDIDDKNIRILSLPRDTRVQIPGHGVQKLNHAFAYGGPDLLKATVEKYLGQPILYYVIIDYVSFPAIIDTLGGVEIDVQKRMRYTDRAGKLDINIQPGPQVMDGKTALHFVRFRMDALGDIGRVHRQQQFIKAVLKKVYDPRILVKIPELTAQMMKLFKTDMSPALSIQLAGFAQNELGREHIFFSTLHGQAATINNLSYWIGDTKEANNFLNAPIEMIISGDINENKNTNNYAGLSLSYSSAAEETKVNGQILSSQKTEEHKNKSMMPHDELLKLIRSMSESIAVLNGTGKSGLSTEVATKLQKMGIDVVLSANAKHFDYRSSNIVYPLNADAKVIKTAQTLGEILDIPKSLVRSNNQAFYPSIIIGHDSKSLIDRINRLVEISLQ